MKQRRYLADKVGPVVVVAAAILLWWAERKRPLRRTVEPTPVRQARNVTVAGLAALTVQLAERPVVEPLAHFVEANRWGLVPRLRGPAWVRTLAALLLLDYTLYLWHVLVHRVPVLWRFHAVHHVDRDLDASTAVRFHFGELTISVPWRALQVAAIGVSPAQLHLWQRMLLVSILFHHSNVKLPRPVERILGLIVMTPRLHGIHHSDVRVVRDANWSSGLTVWDWLHGTLRNDLPQDAITIGVEGRADPADVTLPRLIAMPFTADLR
jgi:sterol desaturase/sphingolipid hydroxylase (fatty acid hydroxylase superfamily)